MREAAPPSTGKGEAPPIRVLIVDDHLLVRAGLRAVLEHLAEFVIVGEAATGEEGAALAAEARPDVVVMDLEMPGAGGLAATRAITGREPHPAVLVLTVHAEDVHLTDALRSGASGYLTKDLAESELANALRTVAAGDVYVRPRAASLLAASFAPPKAVPVVKEARERFAKLSKREQLVLRLVAEGYSGPEIGRSLGIRAKTVDTYRQRIQQKIGLAHRTEYIRFALTIDLLKK